MFLSKIAQSIGAPWFGADVEIEAVSIDTRTLKAGDLFVAIQGEHLDGHMFLEAAYRQGASALVINHGVDINMLKSIPSAMPILCVEDTTIALGQIAVLWRLACTMPIIGITGSCGKTSVKELTRSVLETAGEVLASEQSFNNHWGLPLTLLKIKPTHRFIVLEMGANHLGEIAYLSQIAKPNIALITNVAPVHMAGFGTLEGVAREKGDIYGGLQAGELAILNKDDAFFEYWLNNLAKGVRHISFSLEQEADLMARDIVLKAGCAEFCLVYGTQSKMVNLNILGRHQVENALAAAAVGVSLNLPLEQIVVGLNRYAGFKGRLRKLKGKNGIQIIDDSYNANPTSVKAAIEVLADCGGETMLILGEMAELGSDVSYFHKEIGVYAKQRGIHHFWAVGVECAHAVQAFGDGARFFENKAELIQNLDIVMHKSIHKLLTILIKGSRLAKMETIISALSEEEDKYVSLVR